MSTDAVRWSEISRFLIAFLLAGCASGSSSAFAVTRDPPYTLERAVEVARHLAAAGQPLAASQGIQVALIYERDVTRRLYETTENDRALLIVLLGFIEPGIADSIASPAARSLIETRRNLVRAVSNPGASVAPLGGGVTGSEFCRALRDLSDLRPLDVRQSLGKLLPDGGAPPSCLAHSLFFNAELRSEDAAILRQVAGAGDNQGLLALVRHLTNIGRYAEALALCVHITDGGLRSEAERAVISSRQVASLGLPPADTSKAIFSALLQRSGAERLVLGSLLATQAAPEFWAEQAAAVEAFLATAPPDDISATLRDMWSRQILTSGGYAAALRVWAKAPSLKPAADFIAAYFFLREDQPEIDGPRHATLDTLPMALRRLAVVARAIRLRKEKPRETNGLFHALLDSYAGQVRTPTLSALDAAFVAAAATQIESAASASRSR